MNIYSESKNMYVHVCLPAILETVLIIQRAELFYTG